jgi:hypothetical protein
LNQLEIITLRRYSDGEIGWREAACELGVDDFEQFESIVKKHNISLYQPPKDESTATLQQLNHWLDEGLGEQ